jgi:hypothetical protein
MCPVLLLSTHGQVLKDSAAPALAVKFNKMKFRNHNVARDLQKGSNVDEMLLNSISAHRQSVFTFRIPFLSPVPSPKTSPPIGPQPPAWYDWESADYPSTGRGREL